MAELAPDHPGPDDVESALADALSFRAGGPFAEADGASVDEVRLRSIQGAVEAAGPADRRNGLRRGAVLLAAAATVAVLFAGIAFAARSTTTEVQSFGDGGPSGGLDRPGGTRPPGTAPPAGDGLVVDGSPGTTSALLGAVGTPSTDPDWATTTTSRPRTAPRTAPDGVTIPDPADEPGDEQPPTTDPGDAPPPTDAPTTTTTAPATTTTRRQVLRMEDFDFFHEYWPIFTENWDWKTAPCDTVFNLPPYTGTATEMPLEAAFNGGFANVGNRNGMYLGTMTVVGAVRYLQLAGNVTSNAVVTVRCQSGTTIRTSILFLGLLPGGPASWDAVTTTQDWGDGAVVTASTPPGCAFSVTWPASGHTEAYRWEESTEGPQFGLLPVSPDQCPPAST